MLLGGCRGVGWLVLAPSRRPTSILPEPAQPSPSPSPHDDSSSSSRRPLPPTMSDPPKPNVLAGTGVARSPGPAGGRPTAGTAPPSANALARAPGQAVTGGGPASSVAAGQSPKNRGRDWIGRKLEELEYAQTVSLAEGADELVLAVARRAGRCLARTEGRRPGADGLALPTWTALQQYVLTAGLILRHHVESRQV